MMGRDEGGRVGTQLSSYGVKFSFPGYYESLRRHDIADTT